VREPAPPSGGALARLLWSLLRTDRPSVPLGAGAGDDVPLAQAPALAHVAAALHGGAALSVVDLLRQPLQFSMPPDPSAWLRAMHAANPVPAADAVPLRVLSWNLALLDVRVGPYPYKASPYVQARREPVFDRVLGAGADIVLLQELWHATDIARLSDRVVGSGYRLFCPRRRWVDGLAVLVREELAGSPVEVEVQPYSTQERLEAVDLRGKEQFLRSWLRVSFVHPRLGPITILDTHMQAYPKAWARRLQQSRALGLTAARRPAGELVLVGGDLNAGPFYGRQSWTRPDGTREQTWWHDALSLPALYHYGGLSDLAIRGRPAADVDLDVRLGREIVNDPDRAVAEPPARTPEHLRAFTATDANHLYYEQYAGTEQPARLDHLLGRDPGGRIHVRASRHRFTERDVDVGHEKVEPSDHYAVEVDLLVRP